MSPKGNIAARVGGWSARHWKTAVFGWIAFVAVAYMIGGSVGMKTLDQSEVGVGESGRATELLDEKFPERAGEMVVFSSRTETVDSPGFKAAVADVSERLEGVAGVKRLQQPVGRSAENMVSKDRRTAMVSFEIDGAVDSTKVENTSDAAAAAVRAAAKTHPGVLVESFGGAATEKAFQKVFDDDLAKASTSSLPVTLVLLLVAFGALVAAGIPLVLALSGIVATMGLLAPISRIAPLSDGVMHVVLLIGLAVGVDYSLFYIRRAREEREAGRSNQAAVAAAAATSGRAVLVSGITVMTSMAGMYFAGAADFASFATGTIAVVGVSVLASLTVLPALLSRLGDNVNRLRAPGLARLKRRMAKVALWPRVVDRVMRRPLLYAVLSTSLLVGLAVPALQMETGEPALNTLPQKYEVVQTFNRVQAAFPTENSGATVTIKAADVTKPAVAASIQKFQKAMAERPDLFPETRNAEVEISKDHKAAKVELAIAGDGMNDKSNDALDALRDEVIPATLGSSGAETSVTGATAMDRDFNDTMKSHMPLVFGFVMLAAFLLLLFTFRSIVVPLKAIVLNLLSVGAAYGVMTLIFNKGVGKELLGFEETGPITAWIPMFLFVVLFGLSMDYHVFILSRVREAYDKGMSTSDAVSHAIKTTAGVVTSAAIVMVCVFAIFGTLSFMLFKQMGVGLAFAVLLDATLIRGVLLPASMKLLGDANWWLPKRLSWLPKVGGEPEVAPAKA